jgi:hypothetical protein
MIKGDTENKQNKSALNCVVIVSRAPNRPIIFKAFVLRDPRISISNRSVGLRIRIRLGVAPGIKQKAISGTDVMIFLIFSPKIFAKKLAFLTQNKAKF